MYYCPDIQIQTAAATRFILPEDESAHCVQVLRAKAGDEVDVTDGVGHIYRCRITNPHRRHCELEVLTVSEPEPLHRGVIHIAVAPTKMLERIEWFIEKATEMGVDRITLLQCDHSERKVVNHERLQRIMVAAAKQSLRATFPIITPLSAYGEVIASTPGAHRYIAHCEEGYAPTDGKRYLRDHLFDAVEPDEEVIVLIGPEGDFSPEEIRQALQTGWKPVSLGRGRLRTETAALVACHTAVLALE